MGPLDGLEHVLFGLRREPLEPPESAVPSRRHQLLEAIDPQLSVHDHRLLRAEPGDRRHGADTGRNLRSQLLELGERARVEDASNLLGDRLPHVRDRMDPGLVEVLELIREPTDRSRGLLVGTRFEGVVRHDRQEVGELGQHARYVVVGAGHPGRSLRRDRTGSTGGPSGNAADPRPDPRPPIAVRR